MRLDWMLAAALLAAAGCANHDVRTVRMGGVFPARPANCQLELRNQTLSYDLTSKYDTLGAATSQKF